MEKELIKKVRPAMEFEEVSFRIPADLVKQFRDEVRVVVRFPWIVGIPIPIFLLEKLELGAALKGFEAMIVPEQMHH